MLLQPPAETSQADYIILESAYGDKHHYIAFNTIETQKAFADRLHLKGFANIEIPEQHQQYDLSKLSANKS